MFVTLSPGKTVEPIEMPFVDRLAQEPWRHILAPSGEYDGTISAWWPFGLLPPLLLQLGICVIIINLLILPAAL